MGVVVIWKWDSFYRAKEVQIRDIDCSQITKLLDEVRLNDQRIRTTKVPFKEFVEVDHKNLETVVSILESCGMPTSKDVSKKQVSAIWISLHHSVDKDILKKYFPLLETAFNNGDLSKEQEALTVDRMLMDDGKPQLYGTQFKGDKLYKLKEPEKVNARRKEMNMGKIEDYLARHNIDFDVKQVD